MVVVARWALRIVVFSTVSLSVCFLFHYLSFFTPSFSTRSSFSDLALPLNPVCRGGRSSGESKARLVRN